MKPVYKIGCRGCDTHEFTPQLCPKCKEAAKSVNIDYLTEIIKNLEEEYFPKLDDVEMSDISNINTGGDASMRNITKRSLEESNNEKSESKKSKE